MTTQLDAKALHLLRLISRMERLESLPRTGWIVSGIPSPESIAAHVYMVSVTALWIADQIEEPVDKERVMRIALLHDAGEAMLTDLPWPVKRFVDPEVLHDAEERATQVIFEHSPESWTRAVSDYNAADCLEARIVKAADRIQMLAKALQYAAQGHGDTSRFWRTPRNFEDHGIPLVRATLDRLKAMHEAQSWWPADFD